MVLKAPLAVEDYIALRAAVARQGYGHEYDWSQNVQPPATPDDFVFEYAWVVLNSGMREQVARGIWGKVRPALEEGRPVRSVFGHPGKAAAIQLVWEHRGEYHQAYLAAADKLEFARALPWIGKITCFHLVKALGENVAKPDRHLERLAEGTGESVDELCGRLASSSGDRVATVDLVLWRAANLGLLNPRDGVLHLQHVRPPCVFAVNDPVDAPPAGAKYVGRPGPFGNPFVMANDSEAERARVVAEHARWIHEPDQAPLRARVRAELAGCDLACWCPPPLACHATELLAIANAGTAVAHGVGDGCSVPVAHPLQLPGFADTARGAEPNATTRKRLGQ